MKTRNIILSAVAGLLALSVVSCSNKLDIPQHGVLDYNTFYKTDEQALEADAALYLEILNGGGLGWDYWVRLCKAMLTDDFWAGGSMRGDNNDLDQLNEFRFDAEQDYIQKMFTSYYSLIYKANVILGHIEEEGASDIAKMVRAEAKVFRAYAYFDLKTMWGNPPLVDHELTPSEYNVPNGTDEELWGLMEKDLTEAIASGYLSEKSNADDSSVWRVTKQFAQALLGKVYLWQGKYDEAAKQFGIHGAVEYDPASRAGGDQLLCTRRKVGRCHRANQLGHHYVIGLAPHTDEIVQHEFQAIQPPVAAEQQYQLLDVGLQGPGGGRCVRKQGPHLGEDLLPAAAFLHQAEEGLGIPASYCSLIHLRNGLSAPVVPDRSTAFRATPSRQHLPKEGPPGGGCRARPSPAHSRFVPGPSPPYRRSGPLHLPWPGRGSRFGPGPHP